MRTLLLLCTVLSVSNVLCASELIADGAELIKVADGFQFTEGGARDAQGHVYFTDLRNNRIHKWDHKTGQITTFKEDSRSANGCWLDDQGNLIVAEGQGRALAIIKADGSRTTLVSQYQGKKFNSPNDLWGDKQGGIYFTDPHYGRGRDEMELDGEHVYYLASDRKTLTRVADDLVRPNGIIGSLDGKTLYVADAGAKKTYAYDIGADGSLSNKRLFIPEGSDGLTLDAKGNLYLTNTAVRIFNASGTFLEQIEVPRPTNVCFAGADGKTLFITARSTVYTLRMKVQGGSVN
ncbi:SMP-30/gluconolactonase/LRE family protein [Planctomycetota bacterium]